MGEITGITITEEIEEYRRKIALLGIMLCIDVLLCLLRSIPATLFKNFIQIIDFMWIGER